MEDNIKEIPENLHVLSHDYFILDQSISPRFQDYVSRLNYGKSQTIPVSQSEPAKYVPKLIDHLTNGHELSITKQSEDVKAFSSTISDYAVGERFTIFDNRSRVGYLDLYDRTQEIWYTGKTPNKPFVRMIYANGRRDDVWDIPFP